MTLELKVIMAHAFRFFVITFAHVLCSFSLSLFTGAEAAMFSVKALRNITITSFDFFGSAEAEATVLVYTRSGPYRGHESSVDGWSLVHNASIAQLGRQNATSLGGLDQEVIVPENSLQSFMIYTPNKVMYKGGTNDTSEGALFSSDDAIEFYEGIGLDGEIFAGTVYSPRVFRGSIVYDVVGAFSTDTCGNGSCEQDETSTTCPIDCTSLSLETTNVAAKGATGAMFVVKALRDVNITSFDFFGAVANTNLVQIYTRNGPYTGHERASDGWDLVFDNSFVDIKGRFDPTFLGSFSTQVHIAAYDFQSFYIYSPSKVMYRGGTTEGALVSSNDDIEFFEGIGMHSL